jgi:hypothetical protein
MYVWLSVLLLCWCVTSVDISNKVVIKPDNPHIIFEGRYRALNNGIKQFDAPGVRIHVGIEGSSKIAVLLESQQYQTPNRFWVIVDGTLSSHVIDTNGMEQNKIMPFRVADELSSGYHSITLVKVTETNFNVRNTTARTNFLVFHGFLLDSGSSAQVPAYIESLSARKIEFIGDSITAGYCNLCKQVGTRRAGYQSESIARAWPYLIAEALNASYHVSGTLLLIVCRYFHLRSLCE